MHHCILRTKANPFSLLQESQVHEEILTYFSTLQDYFVYQIKGSPLVGPNSFWTSSTVHRRVTKYLGQKRRSVMTSIYQCFRRDVGALDSCCCPQDWMKSFVLSIIMLNAQAVVGAAKRRQGMTSSLRLLASAAKAIFPLSNSQVQERLRIAIYQGIAVYSAIP